ncbi:MAG TPA: hypothetical protein VFQ77_08325 [Pseudonocardiaceae bacterium]|jgi:hypothetical protein|nr:hypothetical protein [Pseudonocardiaceae bacterium]
MPWPGCGAATGVAGPWWVLGTLAVVVLSVVVLGVVCWRQRRLARDRRRSEHAVPGLPLAVAVTVWEIRDRLVREAAQAQAARARPPRDVSVLPRPARTRGEWRRARPDATAAGAVPADD